MTYIPTAEELTKIAQLKSAVEDHLKTKNSINPKVRAELTVIVSDPDFLFKYLRGRKLSVTRAFDTILKYVDVKCVIYPEYFPDQVPNYLRLSIECKLLNLISKKDNLGRTYLLVDIAKYDDSKMSAVEGANGLRYVIEALMNSPDFLDNGVVILYDTGGLKMKHGKAGVSSGSFYTTFWKAFPVKLKELIFFNAPTYGKALVTMVKPFMKSRAFERLYMSSGLTDLHKRVPLDVIPTSYGGTLPDEVAYVPPDKLLAMVLGKQLS